MENLIFSKKDNYAIVQLDRGSSNSLNLEMFKEISQVFKELEQDDEVHGVVLTGKGNFFSAGLDVIELYNYDKQKIESLFESLFEAMKTLLSFPKPLVAAVNGHAPAGGCILAICADYRIMAEGKFRIGLNEVPVGIIMPPFIFETYAYWLGKRKAYQFVLEGKLCTNEEALEAGLVDMVLAQDEVLAASIEKVKAYTKFSANTWTKSKRNMRAALLNEFTDFDTQIKQDLLTQWWSDETRGILGALVDRLTKK